MKLKECGLEHFIQTIKGGSMKKILSTHGSPAVKFKELIDVYKSEEAIHLGSCTSSNQQRVGLLDGSRGHDMVHPKAHTMRRRSVSDEVEILDQDKDDYESKANSDFNELRFSSMTLVEMKKRFKTKKRKHRMSDDLKQQTGTCSLGDISGIGQNDNMNWDDDDDLEQPLIHLKLKLSKKLRHKNISSNRGCKSIDLVETLKEKVSISPNSLPSTGKRGPVTINAEVFKPDALEFGAANATDPSTSGSFVELDSAIPEVPVTNDVDYEAYSNYTSDSVQQEELLCHVDSSTTSKAVVVRNDLGSESYSSYVSDPAQQEDLPWHMTTTVTPEAIPVTNDLGSETYSVYASDSKQDEEDIPCHVNSTAIQMHDTTINDSLQCVEHSHDGSTGVPKTDGENVTEVDCCLDLQSNGLDSNSVHNHDMEINNTLLCMEPKNGDIESSYDIDDEDDIHKDTIGMDFLHLSKNAYLCANPHRGLDFPDDSSPTHGQEKSLPASSGLTFTYVDGEIKCSEGIHSSHATDRVIDVVAKKTYHGEKRDTPPKRIFSTRKVISPTSQEKLCQAVDDEKLYANIERSRCREKLCFEKQIKDPSLRSDNEESKVQISHEHKIMPLKNDKNGSLREVPKGILKDPSSTQHTRTASHSVQSCTQKAIKFSQRQMQDFENLAMKLTEELKSMTDIVEETLCSEAFLSMSSKYTADEIRMAIEGAAGVQETAKKWLSLMSRDCNRFCKIMKSGEKKAAARVSGPGALKEKKKLIFADEAGGMLCHVKVIDEPPAPTLVSESQKAGHHL